MDVPLFTGVPANHAMVSLAETSSATKREMDMEFWSNRAPGLPATMELAINPQFRNGEQKTKRRQRDDSQAR